MATAELTWVNNSAQLTQTPTSNKIERVEQLDFNHENATGKIVDLANSDIGGLDPTQMTGSYTDTTLENDKHYAYRIKTYRDETYVTSTQGDHKYVYDVADELGYPGGYPEVATYNIAKTPAIHVDVARQSRYDYTTSDGDITYLGIEESLRHNNTGVDLIITPTTASHSPNLAVVTVNGKPRRMLKQPSGDARNFTLHTQSESFTSPDGYTIFIVARVYDTPVVSYSKVLGGDISGNTVINGAYYSAQSFAFAGNSYSASFLGRNTYGQANHITTYPSNHLICCRINNTSEQFATGLIKGQIFESGELVAQSDNIVNYSYHNNSTWGDSQGAFNLNDNNGQIRFFNSNFQEHGCFEYIMFPDVLNAAEINQVFSYLGNKYGRTITDIQQNDLIG